MLPFLPSLLFLAAQLPASCDLPTLTGAAPLVIAHRGASGELPEHTLAAYQLAIEQGADVIEPDLVMTRDGVLIARHDRYLSTTTDVAARPQFASRRRDGKAGGRSRSDWWAEDFTLAEIRTLRAVQPRSDRPQEFNGVYGVPTFAEIVALAKQAGVAVYPETKEPSAHLAAGLDMETALVAALEEAGWTGADAPVFVQSFEPGILKGLNARIDTPLVQLVGAMAVDGEVRGTVPLDGIETYADGVGPAKALLFGRDGEATGYLARAHSLGLMVHPWTFRDDEPAIGMTPEEELRRAFGAGVDGLFTDFPSTGVAVREKACE